MRRYTTNFNLTENPISENGIWRNNGGSDWTPIATSGGLAYGTQALSPRPELDHYNDSYAYLSGFSSNQRGIAIIHKGSMDGGCSHEVEILLRWKDSNGIARGYECNLAHDGAYCEIVRWNGSRGDYDYITQVTSVTAPNNGDTFMAEVIENTINVYLNGVLLATGNDSTYNDGDPGIGFYRGLSGCGSLGDYGFTSFTAEVAESSVRHVASSIITADFLTTTTLPSVTGNWIFGLWIKIDSAGYGNSGEHAQLMLSRSSGGAGNEALAILIGTTNNTTLDVIAYRDGSGIDITSIATGSDTSWIFVAIQHVSSSTSYTVRWRRENEKIWNSDTLTVGVQFTVLNTFYIGASPFSGGNEYSVNSYSRHFLCKETTMTDQELLIASQNINTIPTGTNLHYLKLSNTSQANINNGTGGNWTVSGTLVQGFIAPNEDIPFQCPWFYI